MMRSTTSLFVALALAFLTSSAFADATGTANGGAIPDNDEVAGLSSTINIAASKTVQDVSVTIDNFSHSWAGDLAATLTSPGGTVVDLFNRIGEETAPPATCCGDSSDFAGSYTFADGGADIWVEADANDPVTPGTYAASTNLFTGDLAGNAGPAPAVSLAASFGGENANGDWVLSITDGAAGDTGGYDTWTLNITSVPEPSSMGVLLLGLLGFAFRRR